MEGWQTVQSGNAAWTDVQYLAHVLVVKPFAKPFVSASTSHCLICKTKLLKLVSSSSTSEATKSIPRRYCVLLI